jgi:hypothetical protein
MTDFRALCTELLCSLEQYPVQPPRDRDLIDHARGALSQPESQGPTDEKWFADFAAWLAREMPAGTVISDPLWWVPRITRAVLARWDRQ